ncbi:ATP-binding protein [Marivita sp. S6314]|uniref:ATP-binding protein n=1 Tax=Marivita sp. S6314 TaxID=2926406 RepID=UPI001FF4A2A0|nr:ATP-binding protein [Marivita sp. S6314]
MSSKTGKSQQTRLLSLCWPALNVVTPDILSRVDATLNKHALTDMRENILIALAEALNNVVEHAYAGQSFGAIALSIVGTPDALRLQITDWGRAMPGGSVPCPDAPDPDNHAEGGYGWFLIQTLMSEVRYHRSAGCNQVTLIQARPGGCQR